LPGRQACTKVDELVAGKEVVQHTCSTIPLALPIPHPRMHLKRKIFTIR